VSISECAPAGSCNLQKRASSACAYRLISSKENGPSLELPAKLRGEHGLWI
jgi:hypothetical protein